MAQSIRQQEMPSMSILLNYQNTITFGFQFFNESHSHSLKAMLQKDLEFLNNILMSKKSSADKIPSFIKKLRQILEDNEAQPYIGWGENNDSFQILNQSKFTDEVLPKYFKHNNLASFIRQLNIYGFTRLKNVESYSYAHPQFMKNQETSPGLIKRKNLERERQIRLEKQQMIQIIELQKEEKELKYRCDDLFKSNKALKAQNQQLLKEIQQFKTMKEKITLNGTESKQSSISQKSTVGDSNPKLTKQRSSFNFFTDRDKRQSEKAYEKLFPSNEEVKWKKQMNFQEEFGEFEEKSKQ